MSEEPEDLCAKAGRLAGQGEYAEALRDYEEALRQGLDNPKAHAGRGLCLKMLGREAEAEKAFACAKALGKSGGAQALPDCREAVAQAGQEAKPEQKLGLKWLYFLIYVVYPLGVLATYLGLGASESGDEIVLRFLVASLGIYIIYALYTRQRYAWQMHLGLTVAYFMLTPFSMADHKELGGIFFRFFYLWANYDYFNKRRHLFH